MQCELWSLYMISVESIPIAAEAGWCSRVVQHLHHLPAQPLQLTCRRNDNSAKEYLAGLPSKFRLRRGQQQYSRLLRLL